VVYPHLINDVNGYCCNGDCSVDFDGFAVYLRGRGLRERYVRDLVYYARRFSWLLDNVEAFARVGGLKSGHMVLSALANLSRFLGRYDDFKRMVAKCGVRWENGDSLNSFMALFLGRESVVATEKWLRDVREKVDGDDWFVVRFMALTGLRTGEAIYCLNRVAAVGVENYPYNEKYGVLEHFRDGWFLRKSKKAFVSVVTPHLLECLKSWKTKITYEGLRSKFRRRGLDVRFYDLRRYFATLLRLHGVEAEVIDICQGRCSRSIFARCYFRPDVPLIFSKVRDVVVEMEKTLPS
jgi:integrase